MTISKPELAALITTLLETLGQEATEPRLAGYWMGLCDLDSQQLANAVTRLIRSARAMPSVGEIRAAAGVPDEDAAAMIAWTEAARAVSLGPYRHVDFTDSAINAAIRNMGGWPAFCERFSSTDSEMWARNNFLKAYKSFAACAVDGEVCAPLPGLSEASVINGVTGLPAPVVIECARTEPRLTHTPKESFQLLLRTP